MEKLSEAIAKVDAALHDGTAFQRDPARAQTWPETITVPAGLAYPDYPLLGVDAETGQVMLLYLDSEFDRAKSEGRMRTARGARFSLIQGSPFWRIRVSSRRTR